MAESDIRLNDRNTNARPIIEVANTQVGLMFTEGVISFVLKPLDGDQTKRLYDLLTDAINGGCVHVHLAPAVAHGVIAIDEGTPKREESDREGIARVFGQDPPRRPGCTFPHCRCHNPNERCDHGHRH